MGNQNLIMEIELTEDGTYILYDLQNDREYECNNIDVLMAHIENILSK